MPKDGRKSKKPKIKISTYTPTTLEAPYASNQPLGSSSRTLQTTKLKYVPDAGFKLATKAAPSGLCAPDAALNDTRTTEEILGSWLDASEQNGWDPAYIDSFLEKDLLPPTEDPEADTSDDNPRRPTGQGDRAKHGSRLKPTPTTLTVASDSEVERTLLVRVRSNPSDCESNLAILPELILRMRVFHKESSYPASRKEALSRNNDQPEVCGDVSSFEIFELLQYESKVSPYELYNSISRLTDNTGIGEVKFLTDGARVAAPQASKADVKRGHDPIRLCKSETKEGEYQHAEGWEDEPEEETRYIHALNLALDACFRLKRKDVSSEKADPGLSKGFSYFVNQPKFLNYLENTRMKSNRRAHCSRHDAVNLADVSPGQGYAASGVATVESPISRVRPPERERPFFISYDIACQWSKALIARITAIGPHVTNSPKQRKGPLPCPEVSSPRPYCRLPNQIRFYVYSGSWAGGWRGARAWMGLKQILSLPVRGKWVQVLDATLRFQFRGLQLAQDHWFRCFTFEEDGHRLYRRSRRIPSLTKSSRKHLTPLWSKTGQRRWLHGNETRFRIPTPSKPTVTVPTQTAVRRAFADEEAAAIAAGKDQSLSPEISPSVLISRGIDLEADQSFSSWCYRYRGTDGALQTCTQAEMKQTWTHSRGSRTNANPTSFECPRFVGLKAGRQAPVDSRLIEIEYALREAQAQEALTTLRRCLQRRVTVYDLKKRWLRGAMATPELDERDEETMTSKQKERKRGGRTRTGRTVSWIWRHASAALDNHTSMRPKGRNEANNTVFLLGRRKDWYQSATAKQTLGGIEEDYNEGLQAYAKRQGAICLGLRKEVEHMWSGVDGQISGAMAEIRDPALFYVRRKQEEVKINVHRVCSARALTKAAASGLSYDVLGIFGWPKIPKTPRCGSLSSCTEIRHLETGPTDTVKIGALIGAEGGSGLLCTPRKVVGIRIVVRTKVRFVLLSSTGAPSVNYDTSARTKVCFVGMPKRATKGLPKPPGAYSAPRTPGGLMITSARTKVPHREEAAPEIREVHQGASVTRVPQLNKRTLTHPTSWPNRFGAPAGVGADQIPVHTKSCAHQGVAHWRASASTQVHIAHPGATPGPDDNICAHQGAHREEAAPRSHGKLVHQGASVTRQFCPDISNASVINGGAPWCMAIFTLTPPWTCLLFSALQWALPHRQRVLGPAFSSNSGYEGAQSLFLQPIDIYRDAISLADVEDVL
ncbi:hypothetical protein DFP72DRAFT_863318 [Ephemerocybe angulata]|uniref:Uncharacterized protein n=1 Tax=Ephemerocybe angulata TaxID=980116 RepID=A0A8H6H7M5_9AGAR|nr:hypothetical protein DFP72DRAFT_863318 [Tulosesus angulatus]